MELQATITWSLFLDEEPLAIEEDLLENLREGNSYRSETVDFEIPQLLQEVYYVERLSKSEGSEPEQILTMRDKAFDYVRIIHGLLKELLNDRYEHLIKDDVLDGNLYEDLKDKKGCVFDKYVDGNLSEPFSSRNAAYKVFSLLPQKYKSRFFDDFRWDVVASHDIFTKYWNRGLLALAEMHKYIYIDEIASLKKELHEIAKNKKLQKNYLKEQKGCFSKTEIKKENDVQENVLCFSGVTFKTGIEDAINKIVKSGHFLNCRAITTSQNVRYYICPSRYVTYSKANSSSVDFNPRMFSCCERKMFAEYQWQGVKSYIMIVKYPPCELCQFPVWEHTRKYKGKIKHGDRENPPQPKKEFDKIAEKIFQESHPDKNHVN